MIDASRLPRMTAAARARLRDVAAGKADGFLLEGLKSVTDALSRADTPVREVWLAESAGTDAIDGVAAAAVARRVPVGVGSRRDVEALSGTVTPQGAIALVSDVAKPLDALLATRADPLLLLDGVQDPGNVGAIFRVAAAFGVGGVLVVSGTAEPLGSKALRASVGTALVVPFARVSGADAVRGIADSGREVWLLDAGGDDLWSVASRPAGLVLAVGSEGRGFSEAVRGAARRTIGVPISTSVESLNAAVAAGIAVAHLARVPAARARR